MTIQAGRHDLVPLSIEGSWPGGPLDLSLNLKKVRIGWLGDLGGYLAIEDGILPLCEQALARLAAQGCIVNPMTPGFSPPEIWQTWLTWRRWLVAGTLQEYWNDPAKRARLKPEAQWEASQGEQLSAHDVYAAGVARSAFYQQMLRLFDHCDYLALPSAQVWPFDADTHWPRSIGNRQMDTYHRWMEVVIYATLAGLPAISVPVGFGAGLPMGMQLIGRPLADLAVLQIAHAHELCSQAIVSRQPPAVGAR